MIRHKMIKILKLSGIEINEINLLKLYLLVQSLLVEKAKDSSIDILMTKVDMEVDMNLIFTLKDEICKISFYDYIVLCCSSIAGNPYQLNKELDEICNNNFEKAILVYALYEYERKSLKKRYSLEECYANLYDHLKPYILGSKMKGLEKKENRDLILKLFLFKELDFVKGKVSDETKLIDTLKDMLNLDIINLKTKILLLLINKYKNDDYIKTIIDSLDYDVARKFIKTISKLSGMNPISVLCAIESYDNSPNDYNLEQSLYYSRLIPHLIEKKEDGLRDVTIFNPSPYFVEKLLNDDKLAKTNYYRFVLEDDVADFLKLGYNQKNNIIPKGNKAEFLSVKEWDSFASDNINHRYDFVVYFGNHYSFFDQNEWIKDTLSNFGPNVTIALLLNSNYTRTNNDPVRLVAESNECFNFSKIELMPQGIVNSVAPKRKLILISSPDEEPDKVIISRYGLHTDQDDNQQYARRNLIFDTDRSEILSGDFSILDVYNKLVFERKGVINKRNKKEEYIFSPEISMFYNIMPEKNGYRTCVYYGAVRDIEVASNKAPIKGNKAKKIVKENDTVKFKRFASEDRLNMGFYEWLENVYPFLEARDGLTIRHIIAEDVKKKINSKEICDITLKTLWFAYPEMEERLGNMGDALKFAAMSDLGLVELSKLNLEKCYNYLNEISAASDKGTTKILNAVMAAIDYACDLKLLSENIIKKERNDIERFERNRISEIRNALVKKSFTINEIKTQVKYIYQKMKDDWNYFSVLMRLMLPIDVRSLAAIRFGDILEMHEYSRKYKKLKLCRYVDKDKGIMSYSKIEQFRYLPLPGKLADEIAKRKAILINKMGVATGEIDNLYVFSQDNSDLGLFGKEPIDPDNLKRIAKDVVSSCGIPSNILEVMIKDESVEIDTSSYRGDVFATNFEDYALNYCGFWNDEVDFIKGRKCSTTFARHYNDFNNDKSIIDLYVKLIRLEALIFGNTNDFVTRMKYKETKNIETESPEDLSESIHPHAVEIEVLNSGGAIEIEATSYYGMDIQVNKVRRREENGSWN